MVQLQFLNKILKTKDISIIKLNNLDSSYFSEYKNEFDFINTHIQKYNKIPDIETFLAKFPKFDVISVNEPDSYLIKELVDDRNSRFMADNFNRVRELILNGDTDNAMSIYKKGVDNLKTGITLESVDILHDTSRYNTYLEKTKDFNKFYVKTGFPELDKVIGGWDRNEELATIVARTNVGKSWVLLKTALAAAEQGLNVGIYSGEMTADKVGYRIDTLISHISNKSLTHGSIAVQNEYKEYIDSLSNRIKGTIKVLTPTMIDGPAGVSALGLFIEKEKLDILFVDQHSLLEDDKKAKNPVERASNISKDLKNLQVMKKIPIISVSQQNRVKNEDAKGGLTVDTAQIAQSDRIGQDSTCVLFLEKKDNLMKLTLVKSRDSENGKTLTYAVDVNTGVWTFVPTEDDAVGGQSDIDYSTRYDDYSDTEGGNIF